MNTAVDTNKIRFGEKFSFLLANVGNFPIMTLINSYLLIFYTDVAGIDPAAVATLFLITRIFDGVNDPIMGYLVDHLPRTRMGRFRPYLIIGSILCSVNFLLLWFGPVMFSGIKLVIVYISYVLIGMTFDLMDIPLNSMIPVMTDDLKQRNSLSTLKALALSVAGALIILPAPMILSAVKNQMEGYTIVIVGGTIITLVFSIIGALGVKERVQPIKQEKYKFKDTFKILGTAPIIITFVSLLFYGMSGAVSANTQMFFATYVLNDVSIVTWQQMGMAMMLPTLFLSGFLTNKFGKRKMFALGLVINGVAPLIRLFSVTNIPLLLASTALSGVGLGLIMALMYNVQADNVDYVEWRKGIRAEGQLASVNSFIVKASSGIGSAIPGFVLAATGYIANQVQTEQAINGIITTSILIPGILMILSGIIFFAGYKLTNQKMHEITQSLRAKREAS